MPKIYLIMGYDYNKLLDLESEANKLEIPKSLDLSKKIDDFPTKPKKIWLPRIYLTEVTRVNFRRAALSMEAYRETFQKSQNRDLNPYEQFYWIDKYVCNALSIYFFGTSALYATKNLCEEIRKENNQPVEQLETLRQKNNDWIKNHFIYIRDKLIAHANCLTEGGNEFSSAGSGGVITFKIFNIVDEKVKEEIGFAPNSDFFELNNYLNSVFEILYKIWNI